eukprot:GGOE01030488.1.p2 GENE.GGOE01030488.1~~GGOE01030488.1.p2  ORF type:complete len:147 (+),score=5.50 GGOE01030488.1:530-970(+)
MRGGRRAGQWTSGKAALVMDVVVTPHEGQGRHDVAPASQRTQIPDTVPARQFLVKVSSAVLAHSVGEGERGAAGVEKATCDRKGAGRWIQCPEGISTREHLWQALGPWEIGIGLGNLMTVQHGDGLVISSPTVSLSLCVHMLYGLK